MSEERRGRPAINDGMTKDRRYEAKRVTIIGTIKGTLAEAKSLAYALSRIYAAHTDKRSAIIAAVKHYAKFLDDSA